MRSWDSFRAMRRLRIGERDFRIASLAEAERNGLAGVSRLPVSLKVLLENLIRHEDGRSVTRADIMAVADWQLDRGKAGREIAFRPARVLMQDFTGVPALVDLAAMRDAMLRLGGDPARINPLVPVDLVCDHSLVVDHYGTPRALADNVALEYARNGERYELLKWGQQAFRNLSVVPPGAGICHQVNLEYLSQTVWIGDVGDGAPWAYPDTVVGTDSHTTMVNALAVLGWGVGGIEAEAAMLGQPMSMLVPEVVGVRLQGRLRPGVTATDLVLTITQMLRKLGVVGKFVEFFGAGLDDLPVADRATIANMAPEYGATCGFFPVDAMALDYLRTTGRSPERVALVEAYCREQGMFRDAATADPVFTEAVTLDLATVSPSLAGPRRPQDRVLLGAVKAGFEAMLTLEVPEAAARARRHAVAGRTFDIGHGDVVIAAIASCTNTSNPGVMLAAGLLARNAVARGLQTKPWVKTSLSPGSQVVAGYLQASGLQGALDTLGFNLVGFACATCIGNSGPLDPEISDVIDAAKLVAAAILSGNRNFEGRVNPDVRANYLASPPLVVAYALAGSMRVDLETEPLGSGTDGEPVWLRDIWPSQAEVEELMRRHVTSDLYRARYADVATGDANWKAVEASAMPTYRWNGGSTYVRNPPYFDGITFDPPPTEDIVSARILALFGDSITTDHISPAGSIRATSPAGSYLQDHQVRVADFNQYGTRRGNHEVMMRGTFANIRIRNQMVQDEAGAVVEGGLTMKYPESRRAFIYDAAMAYRAEGTPLVILAGKEYGTGSSRDWAAKGTRLLGVRAVIAESFERIHRSNLVGMGVLPLVFSPGVSWRSLGLTGAERVTIRGLDGALVPRQQMTAEVAFPDGRTMTVALASRIDTADELDYFRHGGILNYVLRQLAA
ncbi:aconitate hydratase AcnA [Falsiroseomonas sp. HW251]|uniref:aconitate hydratase AcnA n=1 Tax=Falsiroseomonas sp. HW251 TaxID=3390998 RepID=UPI003D310E11